MGNLKWILLAVCLVGVIWPLWSKQASQEKESDIDQKDE